MIYNTLYMHESVGNYWKSTGFYRFSVNDASQLVLIEKRAMGDIEIPLGLVSHTIVDTAAATISLGDSSTVDYSLDQPIVNALIFSGAVKHL